MSLKVGTRLERRRGRSSWLGKACCKEPRDGARLGDTEVYDYTMVGGGYRRLRENVTLHSRSMVCISACMDTALDMF